MLSRETQIVRGMHPCLKCIHTSTYILLILELLLRLIHHMPKKMNQPGDLDPPPVKPREPLPEECCGQGCQICVWDTYDHNMQLYEEQVTAWLARHPVRPVFPLSPFPDVVRIARNRLDKNSISNKPSSLLQ